MAVLNDFGDAGVARVQAQLDAMAQKLGVQKEVLYGYFNDTGHLPQTLDELNTWGNQVTKYGVSRRDAQGGWHPIMPGVNPDPRLTAQDRGGFPHNITNAEDSQVQRFQQVDPSGNIWGGSWNPAFNAAHTQGGVYQAPSLRAQADGQQKVGLAARAFGPSDYVAPSGNGFVSVVGGVSNYFGTQAEAEADYNSRTGGGGSASGGGSSSGGGGVSPPNFSAPPVSGDTSGGYIGYNPSAAEAASLAAFRNRELEQLRLPQERFQEDFSNRQLAQQNAQFQAQLAQQADEIKQRYGEAAAQRFLQEQLGRGNLALGGYQQAGQEALGRINAGIGAAQAMNQDELGRGNLLASLRGPANAFQQMKVAGLVAPNLARALAGQAGVAGFQAPQADPVAAGLSDVGVSNQSAADRILAQYARQGLDPYSSPSASGALALAGSNAQFATPGSPAATVDSMIPGLSKTLADAFARAKQTNPAVTGASIWQQVVPGLTPAQAQQMDQEAHSYYAATGQNIPDEIIRQRLTSLGVNPPVGGGQVGGGTQYGGPAMTYQGPPLGGQTQIAGNAMVYQGRPDALSAQEGGTGPGMATDAKLGWGGGMMASPAVLRTARMTYQTAPGGQQYGGNAMTYQAPAVQWLQGGTQHGGPAMTASPTNPLYALGNQLTGMGPMGAAAGSSASATPAQRQAAAVPDAAAVARQYTGGLNPNQINVANFRRLPRSAQQFTLGAYEAQGYDPNDVVDTMGKAMPRAIGPRRGFVAPAA